LLSPYNNRVRNHFVAVGGDIYGYRYRLMANLTHNWGTYTEPLETKNTAVMIELKKQFAKAWGLEFSLALGADFGSQFGNSFGAIFTIAKRGLIIDY